MFPSGYRLQYCFKRSNLLSQRFLTKIIAGMLQLATQQVWRGPLARPYRPGNDIGGGGVPGPPAQAGIWRAFSPVCIPMGVALGLAYFGLPAGLEARHRGELCRLVLTQENRAVQVKHSTFSAQHRRKVRIECALRT